MAEISWDHWRSFLAVLDEGSLSGAARSLGLTQPTLGRHIDQLEAGLDARLFTRAQGGVLATPVARSLEPQARAMQVAAAAMVRASTAEGEARGTVRLAASEIVGAEVLPPILSRFAETYPGIVVELVLDNRNADLLQQTADLAVRMVRPVQKALVMRALGTVELGLYAHRGYLERRGLPKSVGQLAGHALIGPETARGLGGVTLGGRAVTPDWFTHRCENDLGQLAMLRAGLGIGICQRGIAAQSPDLVQVLAEEVRLTLSPHLVLHEALRDVVRIRLMADHLVAECRAIWASTAVVLGAAHHDEGGD